MYTYTFLPLNEIQYVRIEKDFLSHGIYKRCVKIASNIFRCLENSLSNFSLN